MLTVNSKGCAVILLILFVIGSSADIPKIITYQGKITNDGGVMVPDGSYTMSFVIFDAETGGDVLWSSGGVLAAVSDGIFNVLLGESGQPPLELPFDSEYWLEITIESDLQSPLVRLGSMGYAYMANSLIPGTAIVGNVSNGTMAALKGTNIATSDPTSGVMGEAESPIGHGVYGFNTSASGQAIGVRGHTLSTDGVGVLGRASTTEGSNYGVWGESSSTDGIGVYGVAAATTGYTFGISGMSVSTDGRGVAGSAQATSGYAFLVCMG